MNVVWHDAGKEPKCAPSPDYPMGKDVDVSEGAIASCQTALPYPAKRIGYFEVTCPTCGYFAVITTAGRPDDPRSIKVPCKVKSASLN